MNDDGWRPIDGHPHYEVDSTGRVRSWRMTGYGTRLRTEPVLLRSYTARGGYQYCKLSDESRVKRHALVHRLVLAAFVGTCPDGLQCRHLNGNPRDNRVANLAWGTASENSQDRIAHGTQARGDRHGSVTMPHKVPRGDRNGARTKPESRARGDKHWSRHKHECLARGDANGSRTKPEALRRGDSCSHSKLTESAVVEIRQRAGSGESHSAIARAFGVTSQNVGFIVRRKSWRHVA